MNSNTPALIRKVILNNNVVTNKTSILKSQTFMIDTNSSAYLNNSSISIENIDITYSQLGLLKSPHIISDKINILNSKTNFESQNNLSILDTNSEIKKSYEYIQSIISKFEKADNSASKETYLLLIINDLITFTYSISNLLLCTDMINSKNSPEIKETLSYICDSFIYITKTIKLLYALIGNSDITANYIATICTELSSALNFMSSIYNKIPNSNDLKEEINNLLTNSKELIKTYKSNIPNFIDLSNLISQIIECLKMIINYLLKITITTSSITTIDFINSLNNTLSLITNINLMVNLAYSDLSNNISEIITNINLALNYPHSIKFIESNLNLTNNYKLNLYLKRSFSKTFNNNDNSYSESLNLNNDQSFNLLLSFYISNLNIYVNGTIGSNKFNGYIHYPDLYNLNFLGFNDLDLPINLNISKNINNFTLIHDIDIKLAINSIDINTSYNTNYPSTFTADINFFLTLNNNITLTSTLPMVVLTQKSLN